MKIAATERGYITKSKFHEYGLHFVKFLKANGLADKTNLLIIDGHKSHLYNLPLYEAMRANNIEILTIPPHTSHLLQLLDSVPFAQFKKYWESNLMKYKKKAQALAALGSRKSPRSHAVKVFYGESTASEEEAKEKQKARPKVASPRKRKVGLCRLKLNLD